MLCSVFSFNYRSIVNWIVFWCSIFLVYLSCNYSIYASNKVSRLKHIFQNECLCYVSTDKIAFASWSWNLKVTFVILIITSLTCNDKWINVYKRNNSEMFSHVNLIVLMFIGMGCFQMLLKLFIDSKLFVKYVWKNNEINWHLWGRFRFQTLISICIVSTGPRIRNFRPMFNRNKILLSHNWFLR